MDEKLTFHEIIESIAQKTGESRAFIDKFIKELVVVIEEGLLRDGHVRVHGLGSINLRWIDTYTGTHPITSEPLEVEGHSKVIFKPQGTLKEHVNRLYAHLKPVVLDTMPEEKGPVAETMEEEQTEETYKPAVPEPEIPEEKLPEIPEETISEIEKEIKKEENPFDITESLEPEFITPEEEGGKGIPEEETAPEIEERIDQPSADQDTQETTEEEVVIEEEYQYEEPITQAQEAIRPEPEITKPVSEKVSIQAWFEDNKQNIIKTITGLVILLIVFGLFYSIFFREKPEKPASKKPLVVVTKAKPKPKIKPSPKAIKPVKAIPELSPRQKNKIAGVYHTCVKTTTLWDIAWYYYKNSFLWPLIYKVNLDSVKNPSRLVRGTKIFVPKLDGTGSNLSKKDLRWAAEGYLKVYQDYTKQGRKDAYQYLEGSLRRDPSVAEEYYKGKYPRKRK